MYVWFAVERYDGVTFIYKYDDGFEIDARMKRAFRSMGARVVAVIRPKLEARR
jgi:hypothetical protein